jgi:predicted RNase H-like nuclease (RuvC/YqgF family)
MICDADYNTIMFDLFKRKPQTQTTKPGSRALMVSDPEVERLRAEVAAKQGRAAELEADLVESRESLAAFQRLYESRLGPLTLRLAQLQEQVKAARRAKMRHTWEAYQFGGKFVDVEDQFRTAWTQTETGAPPPPPPPTSASVEAQIKALYRELAKRYHPDLAATDEEREWRTPRMAAVNAAYAARDLATLQGLAAQKDDASAPAPKIDSREALIASLRRESERLDELIERLEREFEELTNSPALQMQLEASMARRAGRDLIGEAAAELQKEIRALERELKELGG